MGNKRSEIEINGLFGKNILQILYKRRRFYPVSVLQLAN